MPKSVLNCTLIPNQGKHSFDPVSKVLTWEVGRIETNKLPNIKGTVRMLLKLLKIYIDFNFNFRLVCL